MVSSSLEVKLNSIDPNLVKTIEVIEDDCNNFELKQDIEEVPSYNVKYLCNNHSGNDEGCIGCSNYMEK